MKFKWTSELIESLITSLAAFKTRMVYNNVDFNADKPRQYEEIRKYMARKYTTTETEQTLFGLEQISALDTDASDDEKDAMLLEIKKREGVYKTWISTSDGKN